MGTQMLLAPPDDSIALHAERKKKKKRKPVLGNRPFPSQWEISPTPGEQDGRGHHLIKEELRHQGEGP